MPVVEELPPAPGVPVVEPPVMSPVPPELPVELLGSPELPSPLLPSLQPAATRAKHARIEVVKVLICFSVSKSCDDGGGQRGWRDAS
jgi:hypothetical protein